jgi:hypothetical protein
MVLASHQSRLRLAEKTLSRRIFVGAADLDCNPVFVGTFTKSACGWTNGAEYKRSVGETRRDSRRGCSVGTARNAERETTPWDQSAWQKHRVKLHERLSTAID